MAKANCVGRVGALAVALGIGTAVVVSPGVAWAQPGSDTSSGGADKTRESSQDSTPSNDSTGDADSPESGDTDNSDHTEAEDTGDADESDGSESESDDTESDTDTDDESGDIEEPSDDGPGDDDSDDDPDSEAETSKPRKQSDRDTRPHAPSERVEPSSDAESDDGDKPDTDQKATVSEDTVAEPPPARGEEEPEAAMPGSVAESAGVADDDVAADLPSTSPAAVITTLLAPFVSPHGTDNPAAPIESPLLWAVLAFARRQFGQQRDEISQSGAQVGTTELVEAVDNAAPVPGEVTHGGPGFFTGSVSGRVTATDPDGDRLTFTGSTTTDKGKVTVLSSGRFIYSPTAAARHAAAADDATDADKVNTFTVTITDTAGNTATQLVTLDISPTNAVPFGARARAGAGNLGTGSVIVTVSAFDFDRDTLSFSGSPTTDKGTLVDNGNGTFTYTPTAAAREAASEPGAPADARTDTLTFTVSDGHGGVRTASVTVDVTPVIEVGASTPGRAAGPVIVSSNGTVYQVVYDVDPTTMLPTRTRVSILDENGQVLRTTSDIVGAPREQAPAVVRPDGSLVLTTYRESTNTTVISIVDGFGAVKKAGTVIGQASAPLQVTSNGTVFLQTRQFSQSGDRLVRLSTTNGVRVYSLGVAGGAPAIAPDGSAYVVAESPLFGIPSLLAVGPSGNARRVSLPLGAVASDDAVIGPDGRAYVMVGRQSLSGGDVTRVYTFTGTSSTIREISGGPVRETVVTADGVYQATYDEATGRSYISRISADTITTSDPMDGFVINAITVTPTGTVYVAVRDFSSLVDSVAVVSSDGEVDTVAIPGSIVLVTPSVPSAGGSVGNPNAGENGYVAYTDSGTTYLAVVGPDGSITRTVALPDGGVVTNPVSVSPDGAVYQVVQFRDAQGRVASQALLTLSNDAVTTAIPGSPLQPNYESIEFGPDGTAYLVTVESATFTYHFLGIDEGGATVVTLDATGPLVPQQSNYVFDQAALAFGADGTAYATLLGADAGVWALSSQGAMKVLDVDLGPGGTLEPVAFGADGTPYVTVTQRVGDRYVTTVQTFTPPTVL